jgi:hypothetical protein
VTLARRPETYWETNLILFSIIAYCVALSLFLIFLKGASTVNKADDDRAPAPAPEPMRGPLLRPTHTEPELSI